MIHSVKFKAVLDTNVIYPIIIRDVLFWFAHYDLYTPKWSENIFAEWKTVMLRKGISEEEAEKWSKWNENEIKKDMKTSKLEELAIANRNNQVLE